MSFESDTEFGRVAGTVAYFELLELHPELKDARVLYIARRAADYAINKLPSSELRVVVPEIVAGAIVKAIDRQTMIVPGIGEIY